MESISTSAAFKTLLGDIIWEVDEKFDNTDKSNHNLIVVDSRGQAYSQKPGGPNIFRSYRYFLVNTASTSVFDGYICSLNHQGGITNMLVEYKLICHHADMNKLAVTYHNTHRSVNFPNNIIKEEVENFHKSNSLIDDFYTKKKNIESSIAGKLKEFGLTALSINLQLDGDREWLRNQSIDIKMFKASLSGGFPKITLGLQAIVSPIPGKESKILNNKISPETIENDIIRLVRSLTEKLTPEILYRDIETAVRDEMIQKLDTHFQDLGRRIQEFTLNLHTPGRLEAIVIQPDKEIDIRLKNSHQQFPLKYKCELVSIPQMQARVYLFSVVTQEIEDIIQDQIKNTLSEEVSIEEFADELNTVVSSKLAKAVNEKIERFGRKIGFFQLETETSKLPPLYMEVKHNVMCSSKDGHEVEVGNILLLQRKPGNSKIFEASQIRDFRKWAEDGLDRITKNFIINQTYNQLVFDFKENDLRQQMQAEAEKLGYTVNQLIILPKYGIVRPDRFKISYKDTNLNSKVDGISLAVSIHIEGRIRDYTKIKELVIPKESIVESMEKTIDAKVRQFFNSIDPERFYLRFYNENDKTEDTTSLEKRIISMVTETLEDEYGAEVREVIVNPLNTRLIIRFKQLQEGMFSCTFQDKTGFLKYTAKISVLHVDPDRWYIFNSRGYKPRSEDPDDTERRDIAQHITDFVENGLNTELMPKIHNGKLTTNSEFVIEIMQMLDQVTQEIKEIFGLVIKIFAPVKAEPEGKINIRQLENKIAKRNAEVEMSQVIHEAMLKEKKERLEMLFRMRKEKEENNYLPNSPDLKRINEEINEILRSFNPDSGPLTLDNPFN